VEQHHRKPYRGSGWACIGLPVLHSGENLFQVARFQLSAAGDFMKRSGLDLQPDALDRLLTSAAELDDTPGLVRPITLNVIGYVLASGKALASTRDAGTYAALFTKAREVADDPVARRRPRAGARSRRRA
jgi:hypothetical protein